MESPYSRYTRRIILGSSSFILTGIVIAFSAFPFFTTGIEFNILGFVLFSILALFYRVKLDFKFISFVIFIGILLLAQGVIFSFVSLRTASGIFISVIKAYLAIKLIGRAFIEHFIRWLVIFTLISFLFFIPSTINPGIESFLIEYIAPLFKREGSRLGYTYVPNVIIYSLNTGITAGYDMSAFLLPGRNPGPFHEAGGFAVYLVPALGFYLFRGGSFFSWRSIVLTLGLISTFSTAGYASFAVLLGGYILLSKRKLLKLIALPLFLCGGVYSFQTFDFLGAKIEERLVNLDIDKAKKAERRERFANFLVDINDAWDYPLTGRGANEFTRYDDFSEFGGRTHKNNGLSDLAAENGLLFLSIYLVLLFKSIKRFISQFYPRSFPPALILLVVILLLGFSQVIFMNMFFLALTFYAMVDVQPKQNLERNELH